MTSSRVIAATVVLFLAGSVTSVAADNSGPPVLMVWDCSDTGDWPGAVYGHVLIFSPESELLYTLNELAITSTEFDTFDDFSLPAATGYQWEAHCYSATPEYEDLGVQNSGYFDLLPIPALSAPADDYVGYFSDFVSVAPSVMILVLTLAVVALCVRFVKQAGKQV